MISYKRFFDLYKSTFAAHNLTQLQVDGLDEILGFIDQDNIPTNWAAYFLATILHECASQWRPVMEKGHLSYFDKYSVGTKLGKALGNTQPGDGFLFRGRGYVQLTGRRNYAWATSLPLGIDFEKNPDAALHPRNAWAILVVGCTTGAFTGRKLSKYIPLSGAPDFRNARRVINGVDKAELIATYAERFVDILKASSSVEAAPPPPPPVPRPAADEASPDLLFQAQTMDKKLDDLKAAIIALLNSY